MNRADSEAVEAGRERLQGSDQLAASTIPAAALTEAILRTEAGYPRAALEVLLGLEITIVDALVRGAAEGRPASASRRPG
ncbi:hypothetical protein [Amycolatopsis cihanbeyliensis]|uniref:Uncharacterized protein n=1 Tax=Amycolatopsis cihanbeyliensis TaxID=1128664 RepID=A0A542DLR7_AMYCI|nr:hypothetical protein [Amycolatopsis cihanbeyliensis]TQJ03934.1 hypothetical protein FB471_3709 [Amycolatopsis cihanbeyliensis]